ncbi:hypothetical protein [Achromobacter insolitus]|uniref:hypothetical protein n=1 Tax=Achromobacter insolitus TaxID=217204 RepID=UPI000537507F|nr:hypothetical protein [Achromobacter insolitus]AVG42326.1 hypothetical protein MC81_24625 [Achromobacter insolitus]
MKKAIGLAIFSLPVLILIFIVLQAGIASAFFEDRVALAVLCIGLLSMGSYFCAALAATRVGGTRELWLKGGRGTLFYGLWLLYFVSYAGLCLNLGSVPILEVLLKGGDPSALRAEFYKAQGSPWVIFVYSSSILIKGFLPFAIVALFMVRGKAAAYGMLAVVSVTLISGFEKAALAWAYVPLVVFFFSARRYRDALIVMAMFVCFFSVVSVISLRSDLKIAQQAPATFVSHWDDQALRSFAELPGKLYGASIDKATPAVVYAGDAPAKAMLVALYDEENYQLMLYDPAAPTTLGYLINRLAWIPFVTTYDTILYWEKNEDRFLQFATNRHLAALFGLDFADLERRVFMFQFGSGEDTTGNSNAFYGAEAYVAFGYPGVALFSIVIGFMFGLMARTRCAAFVCSIPMIALGLVSVSLISTLFSGGLLLFFLLAFLLTKPSRAV